MSVLKKIPGWPTSAKEKASWSLWIFVTFVLVGLHNVLSHWSNKGWDWTFIFGLVLLTLSIDCLITGIRQLARVLRSDALDEETQLKLIAARLVEHFAEHEVTANSTD